MVGGSVEEDSRDLLNPSLPDEPQLFCSVGLGSIVTNVPTEFQGLIWTMVLSVLYGEIMTWRHQPISPNYRGGRRVE